MIRTWTAALGLGAALACAGAEEPSGPSGEERLTERHAVALELIENVYRPRLLRLVEAAEALDSEARRAHGATADSGRFEPSAMRTAWLTVMNHVQELEVMHIGPAASSLGRKGGEDLRDGLYSWPLTNPCRVDQVLVSGIYAQEDFRGRVMANVVGLDALEQLLFREHDEHTCPPQLPIETEGQWDALGATGRAQARADYSLALTGALLDDAQTLLNRWSPEGEDFLAQARSPGADSVFATPQCVLDELFAAMYHLDLVTKDKRLAVPTGLSPDCTQATCANKLEFQLALQSGLSVQANLAGMAALFSGGDGRGFDALLRAEGAEGLADELQAALDDAQTLARALEVDWAQLLRDDPQALRTLHGKVKALTDLLKTQFATVLNLSVPQEGAGDND